MFEKAREYQNADKGRDGGGCDVDMSILMSRRRISRPSSSRIWHSMHTRGRSNSRTICQRPAAERSCEGCWRHGSLGFRREICRCL